MMLRRLAISSLVFLAACGGDALTDGMVGETAGFDPDPGDVEVNPSASENQGLSTMPPCGTVMAVWDGTAAKSNGPNTGTGYSCAGGGTYGLQYQCVELVMRHFKTHWGLRWYGNAKDLLNNAPKDTVSVYYNGDVAHPPVPGDMLVWTQGTYGHVVLITNVTDSTVEFIEQNVNGSGKGVLGYANGTIATRWGSWVPKGWAHAKANGASADAGAVVPDAGTVTPDAGTVTPDAGTGTPDAGTGNGLPVPTTLSPDGVVITASYVTMTCNALAGVSSYEFSIDYNSGAGFVHYYTYTSSTPRKVFYPQVHASTYRFRVRAMTGGVWGDYSPYATFQFP